MFAIDVSYVVVANVDVADVTGVVASFVDYIAVVDVADAYRVVVAANDDVAFVIVLLLMMLLMTMMLLMMMLLLLMLIIMPRPMPMLLIELLRMTMSLLHFGVVSI